MRIKKIWLELYPLIFLIYFFMIFLASIERWTHYVNFAFIGLSILAICKAGIIRVSLIRITWATFLLVYAVVGYHIVNPYADLVYSVPYISVIFLLLISDSGIKKYEYIQNLFIYFALFQTVGFLLQELLPGIYRMIAWRLLGRWSATVGGFTTDKTIAAFIVGVGVIVTVAQLLQGNGNVKEKKIRMAILGFLNIGLAFSDKRTIFVVVLLIELVIYLVNSKSWFQTLKRITLIAIVAVIFLQICVNVYNTSGTDNIFGRLGYTYVGYLSGEDVSSSREEGYAYMENLWRTSTKTQAFGIGWRNVQNGLGRLGHGVYRELLCETGYLGLALYVCLISGTLIYSGIVFLKTRKMRDTQLLSIIRSSFFIQILFITYSFTGNAIYDSFCYLFYFMAIAMSISVAYYVKKREVN